MTRPGEGCTGRCVPKYGTIFQRPLSGRRFGGTARIIQILSESFIIATPYAGFLSGTFMGVLTSMRTGPEVPGGYFKSGTGMQTQMTFLSTFSSMFLNLGGRQTTGYARARVDSPPQTIEDVTQNGTWNFNATNLTGMISLVRPFIGVSFQGVGGTIVGSIPAFGSARIVAQRLTFLPEPGILAMLGAGLLGITALMSARRRR